MLTIDHYRRVIKGLDIKEMDNGRLALATPGMTFDPEVFIKVGSKPLVLPIDEYTSDLERLEKFQAFHPLSESSSDRISAVHAKIVKFIEVGLNSRLNQLMQVIIKICRDPDVTRMLPAEISGALEYIGEPSKSTHDYIIKQLSNLEPHVAKSLIRFSVKPDIEIDGKKFLRGITVHSPLYKEAKKEDSETFITAKYPNKTARETVVKLFDLLLGPERGRMIKGHDLADYRAGVNSHVAPIYKSTLMTYYNIACDLNYIIKLLKKVIAKYDCADTLTTIDISWYDDLSKINDFIDDIPALAGNYNDRTAKTVIGGNITQEEKPDDLPPPPPPRARTMEDDSVQTAPRSTTTSTGSTSSSDSGAMTLDEWKNRSRQAAAPAREPSSIFGRRDEPLDNRQEISRLLGVHQPDTRLETRRPSMAERASQLINMNEIDRPRSDSGSMFEDRPSLGGSIFGSDRRSGWR